MNKKSILRRFFRGVAEKKTSRKDFLKAAGAAGAGIALSSLPVSLLPGCRPGDGPESKAVRLGIIALTDCAAIIMAHELGYFKKYGIDSTISKEASWAVIRDRLVLGENQATHMLYGMPYASTMGLLGSPKKPMIIPCCLNHNGQAITLAKHLLTKGVRSPSDLKPLALEAQKKGAPLTFAMTFPPGTHAMWIRYWLASGGVHPDKDVSLITIPPAQMVANMKVGKMDGFCVGEPWNLRAVADGIGYTALTTQQLWKDHPEKVLGFTAEYAEKNPKTVKNVIRAVIEASQYIDKLGNRAHVAEVISRPHYINTSKEVLLPRLMGQYDYGDGRREEDPLYMTFYDRFTNFPYKSHGLWWLSQFRRWGMVSDTPDYNKIVDQVHRPDIYREVASDMGIPVPSSDLKKETFFDGKTFDPADPEKYALSFDVHSIAKS